MNTSNLQVCPVCDEPRIRKSNSTRGDLLLLECERCGRYKIDDVLVRLESHPWDIVRHLVSAWIRRENKSRIVPVVGGGVNINELYTAKWVDQFRYMGFPETANDKLDALLLAYANSIDSVYGRQFSFGLPYFVSEIAAKNQEEVDGLNDLLDELEFIDKKYPKITAKGWLHIDELRRTTIASNTAFVAMWFDDSTKKYRESVLAAINYCGYEAIVVDQQEYNGFIMDQVIALIRKSRFLIADFTTRPEVENEGRVRNGVRGGVYWEAGMAYGLGRQVIHTCENDILSKSRIHFDVDQYNTIFWTEHELGTAIRNLDQTVVNPNFAERLAARILATLGKGNHQGEKH